MKTNKAILTLTLLALLGSVPLLSACHTTAGAAQDVSATGRAINRGGQAVERRAVRNTP